MKTNITLSVCIDTSDSEGRDGALGRFGSLRRHRTQIWTSDWFHRLDDESLPTFISEDVYFASF